VLPGRTIRFLPVSRPSALVASHLISQNAPDSILNEIRARSDLIEQKSGAGDWFRATTEPLYEGGQGEAYLHTYVPIEQGEAIVGYLSLLQALPGLESSVISS
jgi:hypothetical protein